MVLFCGFRAAGGRYCLVGERFYIAVYEFMARKRPHLGAEADKTFILVNMCQGFNRDLHT